MTRPSWYLWLAILLSSLTTGVVSVVISLRVQAEQTRKLCGVVVEQDEAWTEAGPSTKAGHRVAEAMRSLRRELDCPAR